MNPATDTIKISEIFYSLQGEGARTGKPTIFIRLAGCSSAKSCRELGVKCDTDFRMKRVMRIEEIYNEVSQYPCKDITWTGGEPLDQLTAEIANFFLLKGYYQAIETSGAADIPYAINYIAISPKFPENTLLSRIITRTPNELRYCLKAGDELPVPSLPADDYFLSPHDDENYSKNLKHCIRLCLKNPSWKLSIQTHKVLGLR